MTCAGFEMNLPKKKKIFLEEEKYTELSFDLKDTHTMIWSKQLLTILCAQIGSTRPL